MISLIKIICCKGASGMGGEMRKGMKGDRNQNLLSRQVIVTSRHGQLHRLKVPVAFAESTHSRPRTVMSADSQIHGSSSVPT